jgi:hypothetical protein
MYCVLLGVLLTRSHWARCDVLSLAKLACSSTMVSPTVSGSGRS